LKRKLIKSGPLIKLMNRKTIIIILVGGASIALLSLYLFSHKEKCPDEYGTDESGSAQYLADTDKWTNQFFDNNPGASLGDWAEARLQFLERNNCTEALKAYQEAKSGNADPETLQDIRKAVDETLTP